MPLDSKKKLNCHFNNFIRVPTLQKYIPITYLFHKYIPFTYLWVSKIHTFLSICQIWCLTIWLWICVAEGKSYKLAWLLIEGNWVQVNILVFNQRGTWLWRLFYIPLMQIHTFHIPNFWKRYVYIPRYVSTYPTWYPVICWHD